jgi:hypothetical protein
MEGQLSEYDFHTLSPSDFEQLSRDLLRAHLGVDFEVFGRGPDGGIDLRSTSTGEVVIAQCKHYRGSSFSDLKRSVKAEKAKMKSIMPSKYYLVTSKALSVSQKDTLKTELGSLIADSNQIIAQHDLNNLLTDYPKVERNHFKLWMASTEVLDTIVNSGIWARSSALMEGIQNRVQLYVATPTFSRAMQMLKDKHVCVLTGAPGVGKSTLADMLALSRWESDWQIVQIDSHEVGKCWDAWREDRKQLYIFDDIFGQTDLRERLATNSGRIISTFVDKVARSRDKEVIITSRTHVLNEAILRDEPVSRASFKERECIVQVSDYDRTTRARILYNHLYFSKLSRASISTMIEAKGHERVIDHRNFTPRLIDQTIKLVEVKDSVGLEETLIHSLDYPMELWAPAFENSISEVARSIVLQLAAHPVNGADTKLLKMSTLLDNEPIAFTQALRQLEGSWIDISAGAGLFPASVARYRDPSCRDFAVAYLASEPDYLLQVLERSTDTFEVITALQYSLSEGSDGSLKHPSLNSFVVSNKQEIRNLILKKWRGSKSAHAARHELTLARLLEIDKKYGLELSGWIITQTVDTEIIASISEPADGNSMKSLAQHLITSDPPLSDEHYANLVAFAICWSSGVYDLEDWSLHRDFFRWLGAHGVDALLDPATRSAYEANFNDWLQAETEAVIDNATTLTEATQWADEIESVAREMFGADTSIAYTFEDLDSRIRTKFDEEDYEASYRDEDRSTAAIERSSTTPIRQYPADDLARSILAMTAPTDIFEELRHIESGES